MMIRYRCSIGREYLLSMDRITFIMSKAFLWFSGIFFVALLRSSKFKNESKTGLLRIYTQTQA